MSVQRSRLLARYSLRCGILAALLAAPRSPQGTAGAVFANQAAERAAGAPYTLSVSGLQGSGETVIPDPAGIGASSIRAMACLHPDPTIAVAFGDAATARPLVRGGDTLRIRAGALPPHRVFALLLDVPRARRSANLSVPITYSAPAVAAASDAHGDLVDARGRLGLRVTLPSDAASGAGTLRLLEQGSSLQRTQALLVAPHPPAVEVHALDAHGRGAPGAEVRVTGAGGLQCAATTDARGNLLLTDLPAGAASVSIRRGAEDLGVYHPELVAGETIVLGAGPGPISGPVVVTGHSPRTCDKNTGYTYALRDSASGLATAASGEGPFGVFIAGIATADTFTAHLSSKAADGSLGPIAHDAPIAVSVIEVDNKVYAVHHTVGSDVPGGGPSGPAGYTNVTFRLNAGALSAGKNYIKIDVGASSSSCESLYEVNVVADPTTTPLGTVDAYFDPATNSYQIDGVLPTHPKLRFSQSIPFSLPSQSLGGAQLPPVDAQDWDNEGQIGLDVHEAIRTDGSWSGTVGGHARLILFNYTLVNEEIPALQGSGPNLRTGSMARTVHLLGKSVDTSLYNYLVAVPEFGIILVVNLRFDARGSVDAEVGVPPTLNQAYFTINPTVTGSIVGSATLPTIIGTFSAELSGNVGLAAPVTLRVPGGLDARVGMLVSVTARFGSPFGSPAPLRLLPPQCLGRCGPASQPVRIEGGAAPASTLAGEGTHALSIAPGSGPLGAVSRAVPVHLVLQAGATAPDAQPAMALAPDGTPATLWVSRQHDGTLALRAQMNHGVPLTIATNSVALATPQVAWIGARRALAVWMASTASPADVARLRSASPGARTEAMRTLLARQQLFSARWDGTAWSAPSMITDGTALNAEPSLAGDPVTHRAALAWVRAPAASFDPGTLSGMGVAAMTFDRGTWSQATTVSRASAGAVNAPSVALVGAPGEAGVAWIEGPPGMGEAMFARQGAAGWTAPTAVTGLSGSAQRVALASDAQGRPVVVEEASQALFGARLEADARWSTWSLGAGSVPHLARGAAGSVVLLAERPDATQGSRIAYQPIMALLSGKGWSARTRMASDLDAQVGAALAVDPATGRARVVLGSRPPAPYSPTDGMMDRGSALPALDIAAGGAMTLVAESVTLSDPHPAPGAPITVDVVLRNLGATAVAAGAPVQVRVSVQDHGIARTLRTPHVAPAYGSITLRMPLAAAAAPMIVMVATARSRVSATLGLPSAPRNVTVAPQTGSGGTLVEWEASADRGIGAYRVYRLSARGGQVLVGLAHGTTWVDPQAASGKGYAVSAVDTDGRESPATRAS